MPNLRIIYDDAALRATLSSTTSIQASLPLSNITTDTKSKVCRSTTKLLNIKAAFSSPETISAAALAFTNLSPTATMRVRATSEASTTNYLAYSSNLAHANWTLINMNTSVANAATAPDGSTAAAKLIPNTTPATEHYIDRQVGSILDNTRYSGSVFVKAGEIPRCIVGFVTKTGSVPLVEFNFEDGRVTRISDGANQGGLMTVNAFPFPNGWWRIVFENCDMFTGGVTPRIRIRASGHARANAGMSPSGLGAITVEAVTSPVTGWAVEKIQDTTSNTAHYVSGTVMAEVGRTVVLEAHIKWTGVGTLRYISFVAVAGSGMTSNQAFSVNPQTGVIVAANTNDLMKNITVTDAGDGWWKLRCEVTPTTVGSFAWQIRMNNSTSSSITSYAGSATPSEFLLCKPYVSLLVADNTFGPAGFDGRLAVTGNGSTDGFLAWGAQFELGPKTTSFYPAAGATATVRPLGYMDTWQSYNYDSGTVLCCPAPAVKLRGYTAAQASSAYTYGGGAHARHWFTKKVEGVVAAMIDVSDTDSTQGYVEASRLILGEYWEPAGVGAEIGATMTLSDNSEQTRTDAGDLVTDVGTRFKRQELSLPDLNSTDRAKMWEVLWSNGLTHPIFLSTYPNHSDVKLEAAHQMYGKLVQTPVMGTPYFNSMSASIEIEEV